MHGGDIEAHSKGPGEGSEFVVRLPVVEAPGDTQIETSPTEFYQGPKWRVLVADDNQDSADSLSLLLTLKGYEVWTAHDGLEAVKAATTHQPDVALLDIGMPKLNGYEVARHIRGQPWGKRMLLVAITGWGQDADKQRAQDAGFDHHLTKPVVLDDLRKLLATAAHSGRTRP